MITLIIFVIGAIFVSFVLRMLRRVTKIVDTISYLLILGIFIYSWVNNGILSAIIVGIISAIIILYMTGITSETTIRRYGKKYKFECERCNFNDVDIIDDNGNIITIECPRCGYRKTYYLHQSTVPISFYHLILLKIYVAQ